MNTSSPSVANPEFGSPVFWRLYDEFCSRENLVKLARCEDFPLAKQMNEIAIAAHRTRAIHTLSRPERGWKHHNAWLALRQAGIQNHEGRVVTTMRPGDVVVVEHGWDRDVPITHCPIERNIVCGYLLSGKWEPMIGLFLPLFAQATIFQAISIRMAENAREAHELMREEAKDWGWYT